MVNENQAMQGYGAPQPPTGPVYMPGAQPQQLLPISAPNLNITIPTLDPKVAEKYLSGQTSLQAFSTFANIGITIANAAIAMESLQNQAEVAVKYYDTQDKLASYQKTVAIRQLDVQESGLYVQRDMHSAQVRHEENMARLEGHTRARLARIGEDGRTERARILSVTNAFSRRGWDMGTPLAA